MTAAGLPARADPLAQTRALLQATPGWFEVAEAAGIDAGTTAEILQAAARFAATELRDLGRRADREGCRLEDGRVVVPQGYGAAYGLLAQQGWLGTDLPTALGGQGLPTALHAAAAPFFEAEAMAFMMLAGASRPAAHLLAGHAPDLAADWVPGLLAGARSATICISEPEAGSDVGRIRCRAVAEADGWRVTGAKCWISFGDHRMTARIGHCLLARTGPAEAGTRGLSLFLVPSILPDGRPNGVAVTRIEEKLGLHGSPTCALSFDRARAFPVGPPGQGLRCLFTMIGLMRLQTACQGLGIAQAACDLAQSYAMDRRQGGPADAPPPPIARHPDIRRLITGMESATAILRAVVLELGVTLDRARAGDPDAAGRAALLLPLAKNFGGEVAFATASAAVQVLGGAGYTRDFAAEQLLRDARVITIYEGTTGMQAQDFLLRRVLADGGRGWAALRARALSEIATCPDAEAARTAAALMARFDRLTARFLDGSADPLAGATGVLMAGWVAVSGWMASRLVRLGGTEAALGRACLWVLPADMARAEAMATQPV